MNSGLRTLSSREREIANLLAGGLSNKEIAQRLELAEQTVKNHIHVAFVKLRIRKRAQLATAVAASRRSVPGSTSTS